MKRLIIMMSVYLQVALLVPHLRPVIQLCLDISGDKNLGETVRVKTITFLGYITRLKKKVRKPVLFLYYVESKENTIPFSVYLFLYLLI